MRPPQPPRVAAHTKRSARLSADTNVCGSDSAFGVGSGDGSSLPVGSDTGVDGAMCSSVSGEDVNQGTEAESGVRDRLGLPVPRRSFLDRVRDRAGELRAVKHSEAAAKAGVLRAARADKAGRESKTISLENRLRERRQANARRLLWRLLLVALVVVVAGVSVWGLFFSSLLGLEKIRVVNNSSLVSSSKIYEAVAKEKGVSLLRLPVGSLRKEILGAQPALATVEFVKHLPNSLEVKAVARRPAVYVKQATGAMLLDAEGVTLAKVPPSDPLIRGIVPLDMPANLGDSAGAVRTVLTALRVLDKYITDQIATIRVNNYGAVSFDLKSGVKIVWGGDDKPQLKAAVLRVLVSRGAAFYDVSSPRSPVTR